jgi:3',5'-cyclic AMP phosphodiesterase CpdA
MRTLLHLSDLHFGRVDEALLTPLIELAHQLRPALVAVSGDLTQRARTRQFRQARAFLDALPAPQLIVPGNHDVPLHNVLARLARPLEKYRRYITPELQPLFRDAELIALGLNTARALTMKGGRLQSAQLRWARQQLCATGPGIFKLVVSHHPFDVPSGHSSRDIVGRAARGMAELTACGADIFLAGHLHFSQTDQLVNRYQLQGQCALLVQAGTAVSTRQRGELNSFNVLSLDYPRVTVVRYEWQAEERRFGPRQTKSFLRTAYGWERLAV